MNILVTAPLHHIIDQKKKLQKMYNCTFLNHNEHYKINKLLKYNKGWICSPSPTKIISKKKLSKYKIFKFYCHTFYWNQSYF